MPDPSCPHPLGLTSAQFQAAYAFLKGEKRLLYRRLFRQGQLDLPGLQLPIPPLLRTERSASPEGEVIKFLLSVPGSQAASPSLQTESVLIPMQGQKGLNYTLCLSSQVGCAMGCTFCETAQMGLIRSLTPAEIVAQWFAAAHILGTRPRNIVFMGMGEPMDNIDAVIQAISVLIDDNGPAIAASKITVSTVGRVDGIRRLAEQVRTPGWHRLGLALSVNAPNDELRSQLMPINRKYPMAALREALDSWPRYGGAKFCLEYVLIPGVNDDPSHAAQLAAFADGLPACINLIPYNPRRNSPWPAPREDQVQAFMSHLSARGAYVKRRRTKGRDMMGACGQLGNPHIRRRRFVEVTLSESA